jgi:DNA modification methylase
MVLDPFVGSGTTLIEASRLGRPSFGLDISRKALKLAERNISAFEDSGDSPAPMSVILGDAAELSDFFDHGSMDLILTSPPYFDIVHYSDDENQIGNISDYSAFVGTMKGVFLECNKVLKRRKFLAIVTADIRKASQYHPIHIDYVNCCLSQGFKLHQILVNIFRTSGKGKRESCMGYPTNFHPWMEHEYILIFQKP